MTAAESIRTLWPYLARYRRGLSLGFASLVIKDLAGAAVPLLVKAGIDSIEARSAPTRLFWFCGALVALSAFKGVFQYWMRVLLVGISRDVEYDMRNDLFHRLVSLSHDFYARQRTGDVMARATNDLGAVRMMLGPAVMYFAETSLTFVLALAVMFWTDWRLTLWALIPTPLISLVVMVFGKRIHDRFETIQRVFADLSARAQESLAGVRVIRAYVQEEAEIEKFSALNRTFIHENLRMARLSGMFMPMLQLLVGLTFLMVLWTGGKRLLAGEISMGSFVMFNTYMGILVWPMVAFGWVVNLFERGRASLERLREYMGETPSIRAPEKPARLPAEALGLEFRDVRIAFDGREALSGVSLYIPPGSTVAIVGRTGCGKSTLVQLIPRLLDPTSGQVLLDGIDLRDLDPAEVRHRIGFVPQETFLFSASLADNIAFGVRVASEHQIRQAAGMAGLAADIESFPDGYGTMVGERGLTLSGGQKQRTAIARALMRDPRILVLDDALSSVDTQTEENILTSLRGFMQGRTTVLISHRVSTARQADRIYVLDAGRIVEQGSHSELLDLGGYYAGLYQKQLLEEELESI